MDIFVCKKCGYIAFKEAPDRCPVCYAPREAFNLDPDAIKKPIDEKNLNDLEKKHIPAIEVVRRCGLVGAGCIDVNIKIGQMLHVMEPKHYIMYIDLYFNYSFIGRYHMTAEKVNPVLGAHLKVSGGKVLALENCNIHGRWMAEVDI